MACSINIRELSFTNNEINFHDKSGPASIKLDDVICCKVPQKQGFFSSLFQNQPNIIIQYMLPEKGMRWSVEKLHIVGEASECLSFMDQVNQKIETEVSRPKRLVVFINPISGSQNARRMFSKIIGPLFKDANIDCDVLVSERPKHILELVSAYNFDATDGIVICGGDGTLLQVLNHVVTKTQHDAGINYNQSSVQLQKTEIPIGVIPTGSGNTFSEHLYGVQDIVTATLHIIKGGTQYEDIHGVYSGGKLVSYSTIIVSHGFMTDMIMYSDQQRWLKKHRYKVVPIHTVMFRKQRLFEAKITSFTKKNPVGYSVSEENRSLQQDLEEQEIEGRYTSLMSIRTYYWGQGDNGMLTLMAYLFPRRLGLWQHIGTLLRKDVSEVPQDFINCYTFVGYKVEINKKDSTADSFEAKLERSIGVDGEVFEFDGSEYEVRFHTKLVKFFS